MYYFDKFMKDLLPANYYEHFSIFCKVVRKLSSTQLLESDIIECQKKMMQFVELTEKLYGVEHMDFCIHSLTHVCYYAKMIGPLFTTSCFQFEGLMKLIRENLKSTNKFEAQFIRVLKTVKYVSRAEISLIGQIPKDHPSTSMFKKVRSSLGYIDHEYEPTVWKKLQCSKDEVAKAKEECKIHQQTVVVATAFHRFKSISNDLVLTAKQTCKETKKTRKDSSWIAYSPDGSETSSLRIAQVEKIIQLTVGTEKHYCVKAFMYQKVSTDGHDWMYITKLPDTIYINMPYVETVLIPVTMKDKQFVHFDAKYY